jgi:hypothetical protein
VAAPALVHEPVEVVGPHPLAPGVEQVGEQPVELVDRRGPGVDGDLGVGLGPVDGPIGQHVGHQQVVDHGHGVADRQVAGRRMEAQHPAGQGQGVGLVQRDPVAAPVTQPGHHPGHVGGEALGRARHEPELLAQPPRVGEMAEGDDRREAPLVAGGQDGPVVVEGRLVDLALGRFDPGPLDRQAQGVDPERGRPVQCLVGPGPEVARHPGRRHPAHALPGGPVVGRLAERVVAPLDLVAGRGHADQCAGS